MQICIAFLLVTMGAGLYALHAHICRKRECSAFNSGYMQAQKEEKIRQEAVAQCKAQMRPVVPANVVDARIAPAEDVFPPDFMDKVRSNGRAVTRLK